jgi:hypothetical protein
VRAARGRIVGAALAALAAAPVARADPADECIAAAEQAQPLKHDGKLKAARDRLRVCTRPECPAVIRADCTRWLAEVEATAPSIVVHATDASGGDLADVRVFVDGQLAASSLDGRDVAIDPGPHALRFEHAGKAPVEEHIIAVLGEQHRRLSVSFPAGAAPPAERGSPSATSRSWVVPLAVVGTGVLAIGAGGFLWSRGLSECRSNIEPSSPSCTTDQSDDAHRSLLVGDVAAGAGLVAVALGLVLWWVRAGDDARSPAITVRSGSTLGLGGRF